MKLGAGTYNFDSITLDGSTPDAFFLKGEGRFLTRIIVPGGVKVTCKHPHIEGVTIVGENNEGIGLNMINNHAANVWDVEVVGFQRQMVVECPDGDKTVRQWFHSYRDLYLYEAEYGEKSNIRNDCTGLELLYTGNKQPESGWPTNAFFNSLTYNKGYITTQGSPLIIDGPTVTNLNSVYLGGRGDPCVITDKSPDVQFHGCLSEFPSAHFQLCAPKFNRFRWFGNHSNFLYDGKVLRGDGSVIERDSSDYKYVKLFPEGYYY